MMQGVADPAGWRGAPPPPRGQSPAPVWASLNGAGASDASGSEDERIPLLRGRSRARSSSSADAAGSGVMDFFQWAWRGSSATDRSSPLTGSDGGTAAATPVRLRPKRSVAALLRTIRESIPAADDITRARIASLSKMDRWTLVYESSELEARYREYSFFLRRSYRTRLTGLLAVLLPATLIYKTFLDDADYQYLLYASLAFQVSSAAVVSLLLYRTSWISWQHSERLLALHFLLCGITLVLCRCVVFRSSDLDHVMVFLFTVPFFFFPPLETLALSAIVMVAFLILSYVIAEPDISVYLANTLAAVCGLGFNAVSRYRKERSLRKEFALAHLIVLGRQQSDLLLQSMVPVSIARQLKMRGSRRLLSEEYSMASVMFVDVVNFDQLCAELALDQFVALLNALVSAFDDLCSFHDGAIKVEHVGQTYLVVAGIGPKPRDDHADVLCSFASDLLQFVARYNDAARHGLQVKIGIHSGPLAGGIVGLSRLTFHLMGSTINVASRVTARGGFLGCICVSRATADLLSRDIWHLESQGEILLKGKGPTELFFVTELGRPRRNTFQGTRGVTTKEWLVVSDGDAPLDWASLHRSSLEICTSRYPKHPLTLSFRDRPDLNQQFMYVFNSRSRIAVRRAVLLLLIAVTLNVLVWVLFEDDFRVHTVEYASYSAICALSLGFLVFCRQSFASLYQQTAIAVLLLGINSAVSVVLATEDSISFVQAVLVKIWICVLCSLSGFRFLWALIVAVMDFALFIALSYCYRSDFDEADAMLFGLTVMLYVTQSYANEVNYRNHFVLALQLAEETAKNDKLLNDMVPRSIAAQIKSGRDFESICNQYEEVSILVSDLVGFTSLSVSMSPSQLVALLNAVFTQFDRLADTHGAYKVDVVGDSFIAICGAPEPNSHHAEATVSLALDMQRAMQGFRPGGRPLFMRIGVHTGPIAGGVIGRKQFRFKIWGTHVQLATQLEGACSAGRVLISQTTRAVLEPTGRFVFEDRGEIEATGVGSVSTFNVTRRKRNTFSPPGSPAIGSRGSM